MRRADKFRWGLALAILLFGILSHDPKSDLRWLALMLGLYGLPLFAQFFSSTRARVYGLVFGTFMVLQAVVSPYVAPATYISHGPYLDRPLIIVGDNLPGISGPQRLTTDGQGFRSTKAVNYDDDSSYRIFFVGASTVAQDFIDDRRTFPHLLQESLSESLSLNVEQINTAVPGLRAVHFLATMERTADLHPDMYVIMPGANDWGLQITTHYDEGSPDQFAHATVHTDPNEHRIRYLEHLRGFTLQHTLLGHSLVPLWEMLKGLRSAPARMAGNTPFMETDAAFYAEQRGSLFRRDRRSYLPSAVLPDFADAMQGIARFCRASGVPCVLVTHPHSYKPGVSREYLERFWMTPAFEDYTLSLESMAYIAGMYNRFTIDLGRKAGIPVCDLESQVEPTLDNFYDEMHFNLEGTRKAAAVLHPCLLSVIASQAGRLHAPALHPSQ